MVTTPSWRDCGFGLRTDRQGELFRAGAIGGVAIDGGDVLHHGSLGGVAGRDLFWVSEVLVAAHMRTQEGTRQEEQTLRSIPNVYTRKHVVRQSFVQARNAAPCTCWKDHPKVARGGNPFVRRREPRWHSEICLPERCLFCQQGPEVGHEAVRTELKTNPKVRLKRIQEPRRFPCTRSFLPQAWQ